MTLFDTVGQFYIFLWAVSFGVTAGLIYEVCAFFRRIFKFKLYINIIFDSAFCAVVIFLFIIYFSYVCDFNLRWYLFLGIFIGFSCERISLGNYIAKICNIVYNVFIRIKPKRKKQHDKGGV